VSSSYGPIVYASEAAALKQAQSAFDEASDNAQELAGIKSLAGRI